MYWLIHAMIALVAALQCWLLVLEVFFWETRIGRRFSRLQPWEAAASRKVAWNMGLYNGFLAAGLVWGVMLGPEGRDILLFFLSFIVIAGMFSGATISRFFLYVQALPAAVAAGLVWVL